MATIRLGAIGLSFPSSHSSLQGEEDERHIQEGDLATTGSGSKRCRPRTPHPNCRGKLVGDSHLPEWVNRQVRPMRCMFERSELISFSRSSLDTEYRAGFQTNECDGTGTMVLNATVTSTATFLFNGMPTLLSLPIIYDNLLLCLIPWPCISEGTTVQVDFVAANTSGYVDIYLDGALWSHYFTWGEYVVPGSCTIDQLVNDTLAPSSHNLTIINSDLTTRTHLNRIM